MSEWWAEIACAVGVGLLLGRMWAGWAIWGYLHSKTPDSAGWRTAVYMRGQPYYVVTGREYVDHMIRANDAGVSVSGIWLRREGDYVAVLAEIGGDWVPLIREFHEGPFSHIIEAAGIESRMITDGAEPATGKGQAGPNHPSGATPNPTRKGQ